VPHSAGHTTAETTPMPHSDAVAACQKK